MKTASKNGPFNIFAEAQTLIEFYDLDPMQIVWHGNYINYFEIGRRKLLELIGYSYREMEASGYAFPVVDLSVKYIRPLQLGNIALIKAILVEYENCLKINYEIYNMESEVLTTKGSSTQMTYNIKTMESCFACPEILIDKIKALMEITKS